MIKNILVRNSIFILFFMISLVHTQQTPPCLKVENLFCQSSIEDIIAFQKLHPGKAYTILVVPSSSFFTTCSLFFTQRFESLCGFFTLNRLRMVAATLGVSAVWIIYFLCAYIIYRAFNLLKKINSWVTPCSDNDFDAYDQQLLYRNVTRYLSGSVDKSKAIQDLFDELESDEYSLATYLSLDALLRKHKMRALFPFSSISDHIAVLGAYKKICHVKKLLETGS